MANDGCSGCSNQRHKADRRAAESYDSFGEGTSQSATTAMRLKQQSQPNKILPQGGRRGPRAQAPFAVTTEPAFQPRR
jgi:hypothetical protein